MDSNDDKTYKRLTPIGGAARPWNQRTDNLAYGLRKAIHEKIDFDLPDAQKVDSSPSSSRVAQFIRNNTKKIKQISETLLEILLDEDAELFDRWVETKDAVKNLGTNVIYLSTISPDKAGKEVVRSNQMEEKYISDLLHFPMIINNTVYNLGVIITSLREKAWDSPLLHQCEELKNDCSALQNKMRQQLHSRSAQSTKG